MNRGTVVLVVLLAAIVAVAAGAYYYFSGRQYVLSIPEAQIRERLDERMPFTKTYLLVFQVTLDNPRVALVEGTDRVNAGLDVLLNMRIGTEARNLGGSLDVSGGVRYDAQRGEFFLTDPVIERLAIQGVPEKHMAKVNEALGKALGDWYAVRPVYRLQASDLRQAAARLLLKDVAVRKRNLVITLGL